MIFLPPHLNISVGNTGTLNLSHRIYFDQIYTKNVFWVILCVNNMGHYYYGCEKLF